MNDWSSTSVLVMKSTDVYAIADDKHLKLNEAKMWITFTLLSFLVNFIQAVPAPRHRALEGYCNTNRDCNIGECCVSFIVPRGKRGASDNHGSAVGMCQNLGTTGTGCLVNNQRTPRAIFFQSCPCGSSLTCEGNGITTVPLGEEGTCQRKPCSIPDDCARNECCVSNVRPIGKRSADRAKRDVAPGHCEPMGRSGDSCLVRNGSGRPNNTLVFVSCPCSDRLDCEGTGVLDIPLGEIGRCTPPYKRELPFKRG